MPRISIIVGTRPNFIKITRFESEFGLYGDFFEYELIHTGQHFDKQMSELFFDQLHIKQPDLYLNATGKGEEQVKDIREKLTAHYTQNRPNLVMVVGDVNSTRAGAEAASDLDIPLAHLESGLRSNDPTMPEEHNRIIADKLSKYHFVSLPEGKENLLKEGFPESNIYEVGNTMIDALITFSDQIDGSDILQKLNVGHQDYALCTMHRPANVDNEENLRKVVAAIHKVADIIKVVLPLHPRTAASCAKYNVKVEYPNLVITEPLDYLAFQHLIKHCKLMITDSGGIQEETTFLGTPCLTVRNNTERNYTVTHGTNKLLPLDPDKIAGEVQAILDGRHPKGEIPNNWDGMATKRVVSLLKDLIDQTT